MATIKKAQKGKKVTPTYKNLKMGVRNENYSMTGVNRDITPSSRDSARYRGGFEQGLKGMKGMPNEGQVEKMGRWEGQNVGKKTVTKNKIGGKVKKAQAGGSINPKFKMDMERRKFQDSYNRMKKASDSTNKVIKKAQTGITESGPLSKVPAAGAMRKTKMKERSSDGNYMQKTVTRETPAGSKTSTKVRRTAQGILRGAPKMNKYKIGGKMSKMSKKK